MKKTTLSRSVMVKVATIFVLSLAFIIPLSLIKEVVSERKGRQSEAVAEVSGKWGKPQQLIGPVLVVPYRVLVVTGAKKTRVVRYEVFLPENLEVSGEVKTETRNRGMFQVPVYSISELTIKGRFKPELSFEVESEKIFWNRAYVVMGIPDTRGLNRSASITMNNKKYGLRPGHRNGLPVQGGVHAPVRVTKESLEKGFSFKTTLDLRGSSSLSFAPMARETVVTLKSNWAHPSFYGAYLPESRKIDKNGFSAVWKVSHFGRNYEQQWNSKTEPSSTHIAQSSFGVSFYQPFDIYQKNERAIKYGILFVILTFIAFFLFEIMNSLRIHPIQYIMIGVAVSLFFLLFIALSEHGGFLLSYLAASLSVIGMVTLYSTTLLKTRNRASVIALLLTGLYFYLYLLLENQDYTLVVGSVALFGILGLIMYITRKIDWYEVQMPVDGKE